MIGLVIATHSRLAEEFIRASEMIIGPARNARSVCVAREDSVEQIRICLERAIEAVGGDGEGVLIMTDMFGGTPSNISLSFLSSENISSENIEVLTGVNLPMVLKFFNSQDGIALTELAGLLKAYGGQSISLASDFLNR